MNNTHPARATPLGLKETDPLRTPTDGPNGKYMKENIFQGLTTEQEFSNAIKLIIACKATLNSGCDFDEKQADWLYYQCKSYIEAYKTRTK